MNCVRMRAFLIVIASLAAPAARADDAPLQPLFNGKDLSGWVNVNCAPGTFSVRDEMIVSTGVPTGVMRTEKQYENFVIELEWRHMKPGGNAGLFIWGDGVTAPGTPFARGIEVQILDGRNSETYTSHGDVFSIHGAHMKPDRPHPKGAERCLPSEHRCKPSPEWNHYRVECNNGVIQLAVNGKVVSGGSECRPRKGYICLESEGSECHFRNIRLAELPSTNPQPEEIAVVDQGFKSLYTGVDLAGWKTVPGHANHWKPADWVLDYDGHSEAEDKCLWSEKEYANFSLICDWRLSAPPQKKQRPVILRRRVRFERRRFAQRNRSRRCGRQRHLPSREQQKPGEHLVLAGRVGRGLWLSHRQGSAGGSAGRCHAESQGRQASRTVEPISDHDEGRPPDGFPQRPTGH